MPRRRAASPNSGSISTTVNLAAKAAVDEEIVLRKPFGQLKRFRAKAIESGPKLLIVAPMSGHYATLLRGTVERMLPRHDVYITDWRDAKLVPLDDGGFDLDDYVDYLIEFLDHIGSHPGGRPHMLAVCQPSVPGLCGGRVMSADKHPGAAAHPDHDGRADRHARGADRGQYLATQRPHSNGSSSNVIATVPYLSGPGPEGLSGLPAARRLHDDEPRQPSHQPLGDVQASRRGRRRERGFDHAISTMNIASVCDMTAEFYLQTIDVVFQRHLLPKGEFMHRGRRVDPAAIKDTPCWRSRASATTSAASARPGPRSTSPTGLAKDKKRYHLAKGVGHYGIFNGSKWREKIAPVVETSATWGRPSTPG
jgi:poly(3-hydroxybutyrate) depolymerase